MNIADLKTHYSGGAANEDPDASLGGAISTAAGKRVLSQSAAAPTNCTGITIDYTCGHDTANLGDGVLTFTYATTEATWNPNGGSVGPAVDIGADGTYVLADSTGEMQNHITVVAASLPGSDKSDTNITIARIANETYDDISKAEATAGDVEYRCFYLKNTHDTDTMYNVGVYLKSDAEGADSLKLGADLAGVNGTADTVATEGDAPDPTVTFSAPASPPAGIDLGDLAPGDYVAFWIERTVPSLTTVSTPLDFSAIGIFGYI